MVKKVQHNASVLSRPPVVAVLGHVDHGKTSLLDFIRKTNVSAKEHGGITQTIGAYQVEVESSSFAKTAKGKKKEAGKKEEFHLITFIDTPGHEAFAKMRSRGANVADIAILVVAADDGVMPQTKESIDQIKAAGIPFVVALNKVDLPVANPEKVKGELAKAGVQVEGFGGDIPCVSVSAKTGTGVKGLLDLIILVAQMKGLPSEPAAAVEAHVIETRLDKGKGMVATLVVKKGTLKTGKFLYEGTKHIAKIRAMFDDTGRSIAEALPSKPIEILGFTTLPAVGSILYEKPQETVTATSAVTPKPGDTLPDFLKPIEEQEQQKLNIVLKVDAAGSLEAIVLSLDERIKVIGSGIGDINEADILLAKSGKAIVIGFNVECKPQVEKLAQTEMVIFRIYRLIYKLLEELAEVASGIKEVLATERELGSGVIIAQFPYEKTRIAGIKVANGRLARGDSVKLMRAETEIARAKIKSIRHGKEDISRADTGIECGILFDRIVDFSLQDAIIAFTIS